MAQDKLERHLLEGIVDDIAAILPNYLKLEPPYRAFRKPDCKEIGLRWNLHPSHYSSYELRIGNHELSIHWRTGQLYKYDGPHRCFVELANPDFVNVVLEFLETTMKMKCDTDDLSKSKLGWRDDAKRARTRNDDENG